MAKVVSNPLHFRYERKFLISELTKHEVELIIKLHPAMFSEIYQQRYVNNLYFDSLDMKHYFDTIDGIKDRSKIRVRWYGDLFGLVKQPVLEIKIKDGLLGRKEQFPLIPFLMDQRFELATIRDVFKGSELPDVLTLDLLSSEASLLNRYRRQYYQSANRKYRITIDSEMEFYQMACCNNLASYKSTDFVNTVVELKYDRDEDQNIKRVLRHFPFRMSKSSKYVSGIERL